MSQGMMSAAIANVRAAQEAAAAVTGLPAQAAVLQSGMSTATAAMLTRVEHACTSILEAADAAAAPLDAADAAVETGDADRLSSALEQVRSSAQAATQQITEADAAVKSTLDQIIDDGRQLVDIGSALAVDITRAQAEADEAAAAADALDRKKWYLLFLGPFGLPGLAACIALLVEATEKANGMRQHVNDLRGQATQQQKVQIDLQSLSRQIPTLSSTLLSLQNGLTFVSGDTSAVLDDVRRAPGSAVAKAFLLVARHQIQTLVTDAS